MIDKNLNNEIISGKNNTAEKFNNHFGNFAYSFGEKFSDSCAFKDYTSSVNVNESLRSLTFNSEPLKKIASSLKIRRIDTMKSLFPF